MLIESVTDLQWAPDRTYFITASKDKSSKVRQSSLWDTLRMSLLISTA